MSSFLIISLIITFLWFLSEIKNILFWLYLWQLKNYHIGRLLAHFKTYKGRRIFLSPLFLIKIIVFIVFILALNLKGFYSFLVFLPLAFILFETILSFKNKIIKPVLTSKVKMLLGFNILAFLLLVIFTLSRNQNILIFSGYLLLLSILTPLVTSLIVLLMQPITVLLRNSIIKKASLKRKELKELTVIGITGSYGKSSTKEFLATILEDKLNGVKKTKENENSEIGISKYILEELNNSDKYFICEMGAYNKGGINLLCNIADPQIGILTGINNQHLSTFGSQENIVEAKFELIEYINTFGIINWDNYLIKNRKLSKENIYKYSSKEKADIYATNIKSFQNYIEFDVILDEQKETFKANVLGTHNISNILGASFVAHKLGMTLKEIKQAVLKINSSQGGMVKYGNFIDATYSSNANGVIAHLDFLKKFNGNKVIVMPCLIELGSEARRIHIEIGKKINEVCDLAIITSKDYFDVIKKEAGDKVVFLENASQILKILEKYDSKEDIILLESRVPKKIIEKIKK